MFVFPYHQLFTKVLNFAGISGAESLKRREDRLRTWIPCGLACIGRVVKKRSWIGSRRKMYSQKNMFLFPLYYGMHFTYFEGMTWLQELLLVNVLICRSHWTLLILCHFSEESKSASPCMVLLDSLQSANQSLESEIRKYVSEPIPFFLISVWEIGEHILLYISCDFMICCT